MGKGCRLPGLDQHMAGWMTMPLSSMGGCLAAAGKALRNRFFAKRCRPAIGPKSSMSVGPSHLACKTTGGRLQRDRYRPWTGVRAAVIRVLGIVLLLGAVQTAHAGTEFCSSYPLVNGFHVIDGNDPTLNVLTLPASIGIDSNCYFKNFPISAKWPDGLTSTLNFKFDGYLAIFENVYYSGNMACATTTTKIWFVNNAVYNPNNSCQSLFIPVETIGKQAPGPTASIGVPFTYTLTVPVLYDPGTNTYYNQPSANSLSDATIYDDLTATGASLTYVSNTAFLITNNGATRTPIGPLVLGASSTTLTTYGIPVSDDIKHLVFSSDYNTALQYIPAGTQVEIQLTVMLDDIGTNVAGTQFTNTARWWFGRVIDGVFYSPLPGQSGVSQPMTIAEPNIVVTKSSSVANLNVGSTATYTIDAQNIGGGDAWNAAILDNLPAGMCTYDPSASVTAQVFESDGVTTVSTPLVAGTDFTLNWNGGGAAACSLSLTMVTAATKIGPTQRLIITYRAALDAGTPANQSFTNVAGATTWFSADVSNNNRRTYTRTLTDGTPGTLDYQDAFTITSATAGYYFLKSAQDLTTGVQENSLNGLTAFPGDRLRYTLQIQNFNIPPLNNVSVTDDLGALSGVDFVPGSLALAVTNLPGGSYTVCPNCGTNGAGTVTINGLTVGSNTQYYIKFDISLAPSLSTGTIIENQASLTGIDVSSQPWNGVSDDPYINGPSLLSLTGDKTPVTVQAPIALSKTTTRATATIGQQFTYQITVPASPVNVPLYDVRIVDQLANSAADMTFVSATVALGGTWSLVNTGTPTSPVIEDLSTGIDIPSGQQAKINVTVQLQNSATNVNNLSFTNSAYYTYNKINGDNTTQGTGAADTSPSMKVVEPALTANKTVNYVSPAGKLATDPAAVGDVLQYTITIPNGGSSTAYDADVMDLLPPNLVLVANSAIAKIGGLAIGGFSATPTILGNGAMDWGSLNNDGSLDIGVGQSLVLTYQARVLAVNGTPISNSAYVAWSSLNGASAGERDGAGCPAVIAPNSYCFGPVSATVTADDPTAFAKSVDSDTWISAPSNSTDSTLRIGDTVIFNLDITLREGVTGNVVVTDQLPPGLAFDSTIGVSPASGSNFTYSVVSQPSTGATGNITWNLGSVSNAVDNNLANNTLTIQFRALVLKDTLAQTPTVQMLTNNATLSYSINGVSETPKVANAPINVWQPQLGVSKTAAIAGGGAALSANENVTYTVNIQNTGTAPAYDTVLQDTIPVGMRTSGVTVVSMSLVNAGTALPNLAPAYNATTGVAVWNFDSGVAGQYAIAPGETLRVVYRVTTDPTLGAGATLSNRALVQHYYSFDSVDVPPNSTLSDRQVYGPTGNAVTTLTTAAPAALSKQALVSMAALGQPFVYRITIAGTPQPTALYDVQVLDDISLATTGVSLKYVGASARLASNTKSWATLTNAGTATNLVLEDTASGGLDVPANDQLVVDVTLVLTNDMVNNTVGKTFTNTANYRYNSINNDNSTISNGDPGASGPITIVGPNLNMVKSGPATMRLGVPGTFTLNVQNTGGATAWNAVITDVLPNVTTAPSGGMCSAAPSNVTAGIYKQDGTTLVTTLVAGTDYTASFVGAPGCTFTLTMKTAAAAIAPTNRLIISYATSLDPGTASNMALTNVAGTTRYQSADPTATGAVGNVHTYTNTLTDGTPAVVDFQDAFSVTTQAPLLTFAKSVFDLTTGQSGTNARPGDVLQYTLTIHNISPVDAVNFTLTDDLDNLNGPAMFVPGSLKLTTVPSNANTSLTSVAGGSKGTGFVDIRNLNVGAQGSATDSMTIVYQARLVPVIDSGTVVKNQAQIAAATITTQLSDDPNTGTAADPTHTLITSAPKFQIYKTSSDITGSPAVLLPGDTLRYTITVKNIGNENAINAMLRDQVPANTTYVSGSTTLNGNRVADPSAGVSPLQDGMLINAPDDTTPGTMPADASTATTGNVATITFGVTIDSNVIGGTVISNQGYFTASGAGSGPMKDQPTDDPNTSIPDDPTLNVVGNLPLIDAVKIVSIKTDGGSVGIVDPGDVLRYTIVVTNYGKVQATGVKLVDAIPANTTYVANSVSLNGLPVGNPDGGVSPLVAGIAVSSSDLTPPLPTVGTLSPGGAATVTFDVAVNAGTASGTVISNQGFVYSNEQAVEPTDADGNETNGDQPTVVVVGNSQQLSITKEATVVGGGAALAGGQLEYAVRVTNIGQVPASNVTITDNLDEATAGVMTLVGGSTTLDGSTAGVSEAAALITADYGGSYGDLQPGQSVVLRFRVQLDPALAIGSTVTNIGRVYWNSSTQSAAASVSVDIGGTPGTANLNGRVWHDENFNDTFDSNERSLANWNVGVYFKGKLLGTVQTDAEGEYHANGLAPNNYGSDRYELRFVASGAGANTAKLGHASSVFTNGLQDISDIVVGPGDNLQNLNLPIDPDGVIYNSIVRVPVAGATVTMLRASTGVPLPSACFDDPAQQNQVTLVDGFYKFDINFSQSECENGSDYVISVTPPAAGYVAGESVAIPPSSDSATAPFSVPNCLGGVDDAVPATANYCEAVPFAGTPPLSMTAGGAGTKYYLRLTLNNGQIPGESQLFNNHIPLDPELGQAVTITKTASMVNVTRGQLIPYTIMVRNTLPVPLTDISIIDNFPPGFKYVKGSARVNGAASEPVVNGLQLTWGVPSIAVNTDYTIELLLIVGSGVGEGEYVNRAHVYSNVTASNASGEASATVRVVPDPSFDCSDIIGKVFDDRNLNGYQDGDEPGIAGVRLATARGLLITTDKYGRFHLTCAVVPDEQRGSNFIIKLDERSLPSGYRVTTENPRVQHVTRGKVARFDFGATVHHVVTLDASDGVFEPNTTQMRPQWMPRLSLLIEELRKQPSILRLTYLADVEPASLVDERLKTLKESIRNYWKKFSTQDLTVETEVFWRHGGPVAREGLLSESTNLLDYISGATAQNTFGADSERQLPYGFTYTPWMQEDSLHNKGEESKYETNNTTEKKYTTKKLVNVVPPILFKSGKADIPEAYINKLRGVLNDMRDRVHVRLHFIGYTDDRKLSTALKEKYGDNIGLSRERAGTTAEFFQRALGLPPEAISYEGVGDANPVASNKSAEGRALNRRVEVQVWYDEVTEKQIARKVEVDQQSKRIMVCRVETVCKLSYKEGHLHRAKLKNLMPPLHYDESVSDIPAQYLQQLRQVMHNLTGKKNLKMRFIAYTDDAPLTGRDARIYGDDIGLSKANARRVAIAVQEALKLPNSAIDSAGMGSSSPVASNNSEKGRAMNRRIEVEFWYDDPLEDLPDEPQICPGAPSTETVERVYSPSGGDFKPIYFYKGKPVIPEGYTERLRQAMDELKDKSNVRLRFIGYTGDKRLDRRTAMVYGDDIGLSTARARRTMEAIKEKMNLSDKQVEYEGHGYVQSNDVVNAGFIEIDKSKVEVQIVYDEMAVLDDTDDMSIKRLLRNVKTKNPYALNLMRISVDGQPLDDPNKSTSDVQRCTDVAMDKAQVRFKYDDLQGKPRLNVTAWPTVIARVDDAATDFVENMTHFKLYTNYPSFIDKAEVRLFGAKQSSRDTPLAVVPMDKKGDAQWQYSLKDYTAPRVELKYVVRVYDKHGHFDETSEQTLWVVDKLTADNTARDSQKELMVGYGENRLAVNNIPLRGGIVSVYGKDVPKGDSAWFAGYELPVSDTGEFAGEFILPSGLHTVEVAITDADGSGYVYQRDLALKNSDWFYVGIGDVTVSRDDTSGPAALVTGDNSHYNNELSADGRLAFYVKGKMANDSVLTASADTREGPVKEIFSNFMNKSPDALFRRIDPDYYYPTFGDDSTVEEDAPTSGKFYLKWQKDKDYGLWGNFDIAYMDTDLAQIDRGLYGANVNYEGRSTTSFGEKRLSTNVFAAEPGTLAARDEFRGTGGSLYYLRHQDILTGSERVRIEIRDAVSGQVVGVKNLTHGLDYDIDYIQGRILLGQPLSASAGSGLLVDSGGYGGNNVYLVTRYEYTPGFDNLKDVAAGGRVHYWLNDYVKLGVTAENQDVSGDTTRLDAYDITLRKNSGTWFKLEQSVSQGPVSSSSLSSDGGFNFYQVGLAAGTDSKAMGLREDASIRLGDLYKGLNGTLTLFNQKLDAGYSAPGQIALTDTTQTGATLQMQLHESVSIKLKVDSRSQKDALDTKAVETDVDYKLDEHWILGMGLRADKRTDNSSSVPATQQQGVSSDLAVRTTYDSGKNWLAYGFAQDTMHVSGNRDQNGRVGVGGDYRVGDRLKLDSELSSGGLGVAAKLGTDYKITDATDIYSRYVLENERTDNGVKARSGNLATGFKTRYSDSASIYMEERYTHGDVPTGLTHAMGFDLTVTDNLNFGGDVDVGVLKDNNTGAETKRTALGVRAGYKRAALTYGGALEFRIDNTQQPDATTADRTTWLTKNSVKYQLNPDWRFLGKFNYSQSNSSLGDFYNGDFTEAVVGYAYRPVRNDALNALFKYTYFYNMPATDQIALNGTPAQYIQKSHVLSMDIMYDVTHTWTLGGKYARRFGQLSLDRQNPQFFENDASLYILRADWHITHRWDTLIEGRLLDIPSAGDTRSGVLLAVYRHIANHIKLGVGYNFSDFSDDLTDLSYRSQGVFINVLGKF
jgi:uncharacterized repeat protein (TIGR01451 family)/fimbrial isopeptide formation D2 family protein